MRKRLARVGIAVACLAAITTVILLLPHAHRQVETIRDVPADVPAPTPKTVRPSPELRRLLDGEAGKFVRTAVRRRDLNQSWPLIHPQLKQGLSKTEWLTGNIPVVPFPAVAIIATKLDWSYANDVAIDVVLQPKQKSGLYRKTFTIEFKRVPRSGKAQWLVSSWVPRGVSDALVQDEHRAGVEAALANVRGHRGVPVAWVLVPISLIVGVFLLPLGFLLVERRRHKRAEAAHRAALEARYSSSSRPS